jgi:hypothetical protein
LRLARAALARAGREAESAYLPRFADEERAFDLANRRVNGLVHFSRGALTYARFQAVHGSVEAREGIGHFEHAYADLNAIRTRDGRPEHTFALAECLIRELREQVT